MKMTKLVVAMRRLRVLFFIVLASLPLQAGFASESSTIIEFEGDWPSKNKGLPSIPIGASISGSILYITNSFLDTDIAIIIMTDSGEMVYELVVPATNTANICIPMDEFSAGEYILELTNLSGNYLSGNFILNH